MEGKANGTRNPQHHPPLNAKRGKNFMTDPAGNPSGKRERKKIIWKKYKSYPAQLQKKSRERKPRTPSLKRRITN